MLGYLTLAAAVGFETAPLVYALASTIVVALARSKSDADASLL